MAADNTDVVVIGGGYAGVMAANRLMQRDDLAVTLINPRPMFVERIRLHQLVGLSIRRGGSVPTYTDIPGKPTKDLSQDPRVLG
jgi:NADH:ubiquinone reductase (H+-translocating)